MAEIQRLRTDKAATTYLSQRDGFYPSVTYEASRWPLVRRAWRIAAIRGCAWGGWHEADEGTRRDACATVTPLGYCYHDCGKLRQICAAGVIAPQFTMNRME